MKQYPPNPWGLYDMAGQTWELVSDWYGPYPDTEVVDSEGPDTGNYKVLRGGSWHFYPRHARSANRFQAVHDIAGFRLVLVKKHEPGSFSHMGWKVVSGCLNFVTRKVMLKQLINLPYLL